MSGSSSVCVSGAPLTGSGRKLMSPKKSSLLSGLVPCSGSEKYLQGGEEKEKMGEVIGEIGRGRIIGLIC